MYDFGAATNVLKYGQETPPFYDLSKITVPIAIFHGDVDTLSDPIDVSWLLDEKKSGLRASKVVFSKMYHLAHGSFMLAKNMSWFQDVLKVIKSS